MVFESRNEELKEVGSIRAILRAVFPTDAESSLVDALRTNGKAMLSIAAVNGDEVPGHIMFSPFVATALPNDAKGIGLAPLAVRLCKELGYDYCVVFGDPNTINASGLKNEYGVDEEYMIIRYSKRGTVRGVVKYSSEFARFSI
jgi:predicted N-acetyltransferase YhbS